MTPVSFTCLSYRSSTLFKVKNGEQDAFEAALFGLWSKS